jgi:hypothetical protein
MTMPDASAPKVEFLNDGDAMGVRTTAAGAPQQEAGAWLIAYLTARDGWAASAAIKQAGVAAGHSVDALTRARCRLGVTATRVRFHTQWVLPRAASGMTAVLGPAGRRALAELDAGRLVLTGTDGEVVAAACAALVLALRAAACDGAADRVATTARGLVAAWPDAPLPPGGIGALVSQRRDDVVPAAFLGFAAVTPTATTAGHCVVTGLSLPQWSAPRISPAVRLRLASTERST